MARHWRRVWNRRKRRSSRSTIDPLKAPQGGEEGLSFGAEGFELVDEALAGLVLRVRDALADVITGLFELLAVLRQVVHQVIDDICSLDARGQRELVLDRGDFSAS
ncbi:hypothetical protein [Streptomyces canus]|uniref:hypothetical protein n=1 Tax=Streptomyces canus TaxID=58343 RepID=UPI00370FD658